MVMSDVGVRLRKLRQQRGLTQTEVSGGRYSKEYVSQVELGKTRPSPKAIKLFAEYLDVDESYFETGVAPAGRERFENLMAKGELQLERSEPRTRPGRSPRPGASPRMRRTRTCSGARRSAGLGRCTSPGIIAAHRPC